MFYEKNKSKKLDTELFLNPTKEYRGTPFWAWNCVLNKDTLKRQISYLKEMGFGGFHMHSRTGMATEYLSDEFFNFVKFCVDEAEKQGMLAWLYDEDRWPSGSAGGLVTKKVKNRGKRLVLTPHEMQNATDRETAEKEGTPYLFAVYDIVLNEDSTLAEYYVINNDSQSKGKKRYAYIVTNEPTPWHNNQAYVDTLSKEAMDDFIAITYEAYKKAVGDNFGTTIPAMFTDEPQFAFHTFLKYSDSEENVEIPWTRGFENIFKERKGADIKASLPELFWELPDGQLSELRYDFIDCISELFVESFMDNCGEWCKKNGIFLTGHMMLEPTLELQSWGVGDIMRAYRSFTLPGMDVLCERMEFSTAKQVQSVVHQMGREGMLSELYGVMNWDYDLRGHKFQGDWQAALGVTVRVPHLSWMSMEGEAKRDYPATFNYQSPWYKEYSLIENHYARIATALTRGKPVVRVGVIHPIETYWMHAGPKDLTSDVCLALDEKFRNVIEWLLFNHIDFDFISESLLPSLCTEGGNPLKVGEMEYDAVIVPGCETLRDTTLSRLEEFNEKGGKLIFMGKCPFMTNGRKSDRVKPLYDKSICIDYDRVQLLKNLKEEKAVTIQNADGLTAVNLLHSIRRDGDSLWLFIAQGKKLWEHNSVQPDIRVQHDCIKPQDIKITVKGEYYPALYNTMTGEIASVDFCRKGGNTIIYRRIYENDSLLINLAQSKQPFPQEQQKDGNKIGILDFKKNVLYELEEPNVYLLDMATFSLDGGEEEPMEELLKIDNLLRERIGWPLRQKKIAQPWSIPEEEIKHHIKLNFTIESEIECDVVYLAIEKAEDASIIWNGESISNIPLGYYVDESIKKVKLSGIRKGKNTLSVTMPYTERGSLEWMYILGDFAVRVNGCEKVIVSASEKIGFGDISRQGMPFYGGNISYKTEIDVPSCDYTVIKTTAYRGMLVKVIVDGKECGNLIFAPQELRINLKEGKHTVEFKLYGNRHNTFAALHNADSSTYYFGPDNWRSEDDRWGYEYFLKDFGIIKSPLIEFYRYI